MTKNISLIIDFDDTLVESNTAREVLREFIPNEYDELAEMYRSKKVNFKNYQELSFKKAFKKTSPKNIEKSSIKNSKIINWPLSRRILSKLSNILARLLLSVPVNDYTNGYRFYSRSAAKTIISKCNKTGGGFIVLSEIILVLWKNGFKIHEIKSTFRSII